MKNRVSVFKVEGPFTEWLGVNDILVNPLDTDDDFREWYYYHADKLPPPVLLPFGEEDFITNDLPCLCDRLISGVDGDVSNAEAAFEGALKTAELSNSVVKVDIGGGEIVTITPYSADKELPTTPSSRFGVYREYADVAETAIRVMVWRHQFTNNNNTIRALQFATQDFIELFGEDAEIVAVEGAIYAKTPDNKRILLWKSTTSA